MPRLNIIMHTIGKRSMRKRGVMLIPSIAVKMRNIRNVREKFIRDDTFRENKKRCFGTFIFEKMGELSRREVMPPELASAKYAKIIFPQNRYVV